MSAITESKNDTLESIENPDPETPSSGGFFSEMLGCCSTERSKEMKEKGEETNDEETNVEETNNDGISSQARNVFAMLDEDNSGEVEKPEFKDRLRESEELSRVFFKYSGYDEPVSGNWADYSTAKNIKKVFSEIDTVHTSSRDKRVLTIVEIDAWCKKTGACID